MFSKNTSNFPGGTKYYKNRSKFPGERTPQKNVANYLQEQLRFSWRAFSNFYKNTYDFPGELFLIIASSDAFVFILISKISKIVRKQKGKRLWDEVD